MLNKLNKKGILLASAVAGLMAAGSLGGTASAESDTDVKCYGVNDCKGTGACGGKSHACAGKNECKGQGFMEMSEEACLALEGGRLTPEKAED